MFVHFLKFVLLYFHYLSYPSLLLSLISFSQSSSSKASVTYSFFHWTNFTFGDKADRAILWGLIFLFLFLFSLFFPFSCWMSSTLTNNLIWIFVAFVIMIVSFALGLIFWQLLPEILTKSHTLSLKTDWEWELIFCRVPVIYICLEESSLW